MQKIQEGRSKEIIQQAKELVPEINEFLAAGKTAFHLGPKLSRPLVNAIQNIYYKWNVELKEGQRDGSWLEFTPKEET